MVLDLITRVAALIAVLGTAVVYGTDVFARSCCDRLWRSSTTMSWSR